MPSPRLVSHDEPISQRNAVPMRAGSTVSITRPGRTPEGLADGRLVARLADVSLAAGDGGEATAVLAYKKERNGPVLWKKKVASQSRVECPNVPPEG